MSTLRRSSRDTVAFFGGRITAYPIDKLYEEMAFLGYYLHWSRRELLELPHMERIRWCKEVSEINQRLNGEERKKNIFDV